MTDVIGRADYLLGADISGVKRSVAEAEQDILKSGQKVESEGASRAYRVGQVIGTGIKVVAGASTAMFAIATKGMVDLQSATADYRAETGATAAEADKASRAINAMSGRNIQGIDEIGSALTKVHTDLGLTGDEAEATTERFLKFARATKQDAGGAVLAFDDLLDAWGLTAKDATGIMDKLIASHEKYGGSITENQAALAKMAPQLKALNLTVDDGIGLLNLFASSGLDAAEGQKALNAAITKLPPGESMDAFIARLATIQDDGERAKLAMEVFGARAGAGLANAIRPGVDGLKSFEFHTDEVTDKTTKAADAMDSTFSAQVQLKINAVGAAIRDIGPGITGVVSALSLLGSFADVLKLDRVFASVVKAAKEAGLQAGAAASDGLQSVFSGAEGTIIGNNISNRIENIFGAGETVVGKAWRKVAGSAPARAAVGAAGAASGLIYGAGAGASEKLVGFVAGAWAVVPGSAAVRSAVLTAGLASGGAYGTAFGTAAGAAMKLGIVVGVAAAAEQVSRPIQDIGKSIHEAILGKGGDPLSEFGKAWTDWRKNTPWPLGQKDAPDWAYLGAKTEDGLKTALVDPMTTTTDAIVGKAQDDFDLVSMAYQSVSAAAESTAADTRRAGGDIGQTLGTIASAAGKTADKFVDSAGRIQEASRKTVEKLADDARDAIDKAFDPQIDAYKLLAANAEVAADKKKAAAKGATAADKQALLEAQKDQASYTLELARAGNTNNNAYRKGLADLKQSIVDATGPTKIALKGILDQIQDIDRLHPSVTIEISAILSKQVAQFGLAGGVIQDFSNSFKKRARGGPIDPYEIYKVGEEGPEWFVSDKAGKMLPHGVSPFMAAPVWPAANASMAGAGATQTSSSIVVGDIHITLHATAPIRDWAPRELDELGDRLGQRVRAAIIGPNR